jgi:hypothetical protein
LSTCGEEGEAEEEGVEEEEIVVLEEDEVEEEEEEEEVVVEEEEVVVVEEEEVAEEQEQEEELVVPEFVLTSKTKGIVRMGATANISMAVLGRITQPREAVPKAHPVYKLTVQRGMCKIAIASSNSSRIHIKVIWLM